MTLPMWNMVPTQPMTLPMKYLVLSILWLYHCEIGLEPWPYCHEIALTWTMTLPLWDWSHMNYNLTAVRLISHELTTVRLVSHESWPYHCEIGLTWTMTLPLSDWSHLNHDLPTVRLVSHEPWPSHCEIGLIWTMTLPLWDWSHVNHDLTPVRLVSHEPSPYHCETDLMWTMTLALWDCSHVNYDLTAVRFGPTTGTAPAVLPSPFLTTISLAGNTETDAHHLQLLFLVFVRLHTQKNTATATLK